MKNSMKMTETNNKDNINKRESNEVEIDALREQLRYKEQDRDRVWESYWFLLWLFLLIIGLIIVIIICIARSSKSSRLERECREIRERIYQLEREKNRRSNF